MIGTPEFRKMSLEELRRKFDPKIVDRANRTAITRVTRKVRTAVSRDVRQVYNVKAGDIGSTVKLIARRRGPIENRILLYTGAGIAMEKFGAKQKRVKSARGRRRGVTVLIRKDRGRKLVGTPRGFGGGAFMAKGRVLARRTESRTPVWFVYGPSIPQMVGNDIVIEKYYDVVQREYPIELERAMRVFSERAR